MRPVKQVHLFSLLLGKPALRKSSARKLISLCRWKFKTLGLAVVPIVIATPFVAFLGGWLADKVSNAVARRNGGRREPEGHLLNLVFPLISGIAGCVLFGYAAQNIKVVHWSVLLFSIFLIVLGFLTANTVLAVYIVESYPQWAGYVFHPKRESFASTSPLLTSIIQTCSCQCIQLPLHHRLRHVFPRHNLD